MKKIRPHIYLAEMKDRFNNSGLMIEQVELKRLLQKAKTPLYVSSLTAISERIKLYQSSLRAHFYNSHIFYACKANFARPILQQVVQDKAGIDIVSIGEWHAAIAAGCQPQNICFAGVGKQRHEWQKTILRGIGYINVENLAELDAILAFIMEQKHNLSSIPIISLRLNPCIDIPTHPHLKTGALNSKFGILFSHFQAWLLEKKQRLSPEIFNLELKPLQGVHVHIGSQLRDSEIFIHTIEKVLQCIQFMFENAVKVRLLDLGGGLGVPISGISPHGEDIYAHVNFLCTTFKQQSDRYPQLKNFWGTDFENLTLCLEPGRSIVASSTIFLTTVLYTKINSNSDADKQIECYRFCIVDGAMNDFPRPSLYGAQHAVELVNFVNIEAYNAAAQLLNWKIVGPVCESGDFLAEKSILPSMHSDDILAFFEAGAYCRSMASQYNLRELPNELFVKHDDIYTL